MNGFHDCAVQKMQISVIQLIKCCVWLCQQFGKILKMHSQNKGVNWFLRNWWLVLWSDFGLKPPIIRWWCKFRDPVRLIGICVWPQARSLCNGYCYFSIVTICSVMYLTCLTTGLRNLDLIKSVVKLIFCSWCLN